MLPLWPEDINHNEIRSLYLGWNKMFFLEWFPFHVLKVTWARDTTIFEKCLLLRLCPHAGKSARSAATKFSELRA